MNRDERSADFESATGEMIDGALCKVWTALPAVVQSVNFTAQTITAQPAIQGTISTQAGESQGVSMPLLVDVPFIFPKCAGFALTLPIKAGDECLIIFASRCIDSWWQNGGIDNPPAEIRMHDLSDGFAVFAPTSQPKRLAGWSAENIQLRNTAGDVFIEITPAGLVRVKAKQMQADIDGDISMNCGGGFSVTAGGSVSVKGASITQEGSSVDIKGDTTVTGGFAQNGSGATFSGDVNAAGISLKSHTHGGVKSGSDSTGSPQ